MPSCLLNRNEIQLNIKKYRVFQNYVVILNFFTIEKKLLRKTKCFSQEAIKCPKLRPTVEF